MFKYTYINRVYIGYLRVQKLPPQKSPAPPPKKLLSLKYIRKIIQADKVSAHEVNINFPVEGVLNSTVIPGIVTQNSPDYISKHIHFKRFPGE